MSKVLIIGALPESLINFRGDLIRLLTNSGHKVIGMASEDIDKISPEFFELNAEYRFYPVQRNGLNPLNDLLTFFALRKAFLELKPDIVLAYTIKPIIWSGLSLRGISTPRFFALVTGLGFAFQDGGPSRRFLVRVVSILYRLSLARAIRVIFQNRDNRDKFIERQIVPSEKCSLVNGSGVDLQRFAVAPLTDGHPVFLTIGRLLSEKGFREYVQAARLVKALYPDTVFKLVGPVDPSPDGIPLEEVRSWGANGWVEYLGSTNDVRPFIAAAHIFVLPSYHEGMPRTVLEAMAMGRPILTTDVPGCRETVATGDNGFLVPKASVESLVERMVWFIEHRDRWQQMGQRSRQLAEERFDVHKINRELLLIMGLEPAR